MSIKPILVVLSLTLFTALVCNNIFAVDKPADTKPAKPAAKKAPAKPDPYEQIKDTPGLPRVLLIGDSISMGYTHPTRDLLKGKANVHRPAENCSDTRNGVKKIDTWLAIGNGKWDVIHFNFGLHDLKYVDKDGKMTPLKEGSSPEEQGLKQNDSLEEYEKNLRFIVEQLKKTNAKLIWRATTPVPVGAKGRPGGEEKAYNIVAKKVMDENKIEIQDLNKMIQDNPSYQRPKDVHYVEAGNAALAKEVANVIEAALPKK